MLLDKLSPAAVDIEMNANGPDENSSLLQFPNTKPMLSEDVMQVFIAGMNNGYDNNLLNLGNR